jgi:hypothetical protein
MKFLTMMQVAIRMKEAGLEKADYIEFAKVIWETLNLNETMVEAISQDLIDENFKDLFHRYPSGWVSIEYELPEDGETVLITDGVDMCVSSFHRYCDIWKGGYIISTEITHWMPLPQPPKSNL